MRSRDSRGRVYPDHEPAHRTACQRNRDRIIHTTAFRRLEHKTQVFVVSEGDYYRTRLTHTLEVAQIGRTLARTLGVTRTYRKPSAWDTTWGWTPAPSWTRSTATASFALLSAGVSPTLRAPRPTA